MDRAGVHGVGAWLDVGMAWAHGAVCTQGVLCSWGLMRMPVHSQELGLRLAGRGCLGLR